MEDINTYPWLLWLHIFTAIVFFFVHGTAMTIAFRLPQEESMAGMSALLSLTGMTLPFLFGSYLLLQAFGIALTFMATCGGNRLGRGCPSFC
jgi:hypothetical protein